MATATKEKKKREKKSLNSSKEKKLTKKQQEFIKLMREASELGAKLYKEGKLKRFNRADIYGTY